MEGGRGIRGGGVEGQEGVKQGSTVLAYSFTLGTVLLLLRSGTTCKPSGLNPASSLPLSLSLSLALSPSLSLSLSRSLSLSLSRSLALSLSLYSKSLNKQSNVLENVDGICPSGADLTFACGKSFVSRPLSFCPSLYRGMH